MVRRRLDLPVQREPLKQLAQEPNQVVEGIRARSYSSLAIISASSFWTYSESSGWPRTRDRELIAFWISPFLTK